ncbi:MAG: hypothetical protein ACI4QD_08160 [Kiritimatiellia bacterium]
MAQQVVAAFLFCTGWGGTTITPSPSALDGAFDTMPLSCGSGRSKIDSRGDFGDLACRTLDAWPYALTEDLDSGCAGLVREAAHRSVF